MGGQADRQPVDVISWIRALCDGDGAASAVGLAVIKTADSASKHTHTSFIWAHLCGRYLRHNVYIILYSSSIDTLLYLPNLTLALTLARREIIISHRIWWWCTAHISFTSRSRFGICLLVWCLCAVPAVRQLMNVSELVSARCAYLYNI